MAEIKHTSTDGISFFSEPIYKFIREFGFPVVVCIFMFWFIWSGQKNQEENNRQTQTFIYELVKSEQTERRKQQEVLEKQTQLLQILVEKVERLDRKQKD